ncbi:2OG-Fe(II) oxygenase [uncultured Hyphomicrobium sp.]|uniref:2OG-Fe(II) oxygenase n=1 Tax=uncultured Hyphomicrobium sp. TaxID=194373 RepID=UPI0025D7760D|nr:2OG-Fe(II) oxygenase [uncultured Hyphomicrobium sp.]
MSISADDVVMSLLDAFPRARQADEPYRYWFATRCLPPELLDEIRALPFVAPDLEGMSGKRELHNQSRRYFDVEARTAFACVAGTATAFQDTRVTDAIEGIFGARLRGTSLRIEYAQDVDGFWLEPHTDIGVKMFTFLLYLSKDMAHADLGTDIYDHDKQWVGRTPYYANTGMIFVPSSNTYHGFEKRPIEGVRKLLVINYVTQDWQAREQLAFPGQAIGESAAAVS